VSFQRESGLREEFSRCKANLDNLDALASNRGRDLDANERAQYDGSISRMEAISDEMSRMKRSDAVADVNRSMGFGRPSFDERPSMGDQLKIRGLHELGRDNGAFDELSRVVAHGVQADGTAPVTIEGDLVKFVDASRNAINASRRLPMPDNHAKTFNRPRVTQRTTVGQQVTEGDVLSSQRLQTTGDLITKQTRGGVLSLSEQEIDWTDPAMLGLAVQDLAESYAIDTDKVLTTAVETALTASVQTVCSLTAASDVFLKAVAASAAATYATAKKLPDTFFCAVDRWAYLIGLTDGQGRPLFPSVNPQNVVGTGSTATSFEGLSIAGLRVVVDPNFTAGVWGTAVSSLVEFYEQDKGLLSIAAPSTLEVQYAYRGYVAANVYVQGVNALETS